MGGGGARKAPLGTDCTFWHENAIRRHFSEGKGSPLPHMVPKKYALDPPCSPSDYKGTKVVLGPLGVILGNLF